MNVSSAALLLCLLALSAPAPGQPLFEDGFENGLGERWRGDPGRGDIRITEYAGNHTLRLTRDAWAATVIPLQGRSGIRVSASFAADDLEGRDACLLETSLDGQDWQTIGRIEDGQDDAVTLHRLGAEQPGADGQNWIAIRLRIAGNTGNDTCWADNLRVDAEPQRLELNAEIPPGAAPLQRPVASAAFAPAPGTAPLGARTVRLYWQGGRQADGVRVLHDEFDYADGGTVFDIPALDIGLAIEGHTVRPLIRGPIAGDSPDWEWVIQPGWAGRLASGRARVILPVALQERNANCIHTGWLALDLADGGRSTPAVLEIGAETCAYFQFDLWTRLDVALAPAVAASPPPPDPAPLQRRPVTDLASRFPGIDPEMVGSPLEVTPAAMSIFGLMIDDTLYAGDCLTRFGSDPYCTVLPLPSYSLAKSVVAGLALMRLEQLYPGARDALISRYVPACDDARWTGVTFEHALDMATGLYSDPGFEADEGAPELWAFMSRSDHAGRITQACGQHPRQAEPGTQWVYHTTDTYILGTAVQAFWREQSGRAEADFYTDLLAPLWRELDLSPLIQTTRRSYDDTAQPVSGWGLTLTLDDMMKLGRFLQDGTRLNGEAWADPDMIAQALQRVPGERGLQAGGPDQRYQNGFWAWNAGPALDCDQDVWIPALSGYGGITVALIPNGHVYAYFSDGREFAWRRAAQASNAIEPFCEVQP